MKSNRLSHILLMKMIVFLLLAIFILKCECNCLLLFFFFSADGENSKEQGYCPSFGFAQGMLLIFEI